MRCKFIAIASLISMLSFADRAAIHRMYVFGSEKIYASHLAMLSMPVHQYQVLWEVDFGEVVNAKYRAEIEHRRAHPLPPDSEPDDNEDVFTLNPVAATAADSAEFILPDVIKASENNAGTDHPKTITADLYSVHFERKNKPEDFLIASKVTVKLKRVVYKSPGRFVPDAIRPDHLTYQLFGTAKEAFLTHVITSFPKDGSSLDKDQGDEFDHFVPVTVTDEICEAR
jgi:hypothetical protein